MAGGMWLVTGVGGLAGGALAGGGRGLLELGAGQARVELVKLQMSYKLNVLHTTGHIAKAQAVAKKLQETQDELKRELEVERQLNDKNARRLKDIEEKLKAVEAAQAYVDQNEPVAA